MTAPDPATASRALQLAEAAVLRRAADAIEALPQDYECDPGRGDTVERLRRTAAGIEEKSGARSAGVLVFEAYDGELAMLRGLVRTLRTVVRDDRADVAQREVRRLLYEHATDERDAYEGKSSREADATPDFFQPGRTYQRALWRFQCIAVSRHPVTGDLCAHGWEHTEPLNNPHDAVKWPEDWHRWSDAQ